MKQDLVELGIWAGFLALLLLFAKRVERFLHKIYGDIDKVEFAGFLFTAAFFWMLWKEGTREHEWQIFSEFMIFIVSGAALTGLGLKSVFKGIKELKGGQNEPADPKGAADDSEAPK